MPFSDDVDRMPTFAVRQALRDARDEIRQLRSELATYRPVVAPPDGPTHADLCTYPGCTELGGCEGGRCFSHLGVDPDAVAAAREALAANQSYYGVGNGH